MAEKRTIELEIQDNSKSLKAQYKEAVQELQKVSAQYGETSEQAVKAAKAAAELKDQIAFSKDLVEAFNPDAKFKAVEGAVNGVMNGFQAFTGGMALLGVESEKVEEALLKVQSVMALTQGINGLMEARDSFKQLGIVAGNALKGIKSGLAATGIGLFVVALGTVVAYWDDIKAAVSGVSEEQKKLNKDTEKNAETSKKQYENFQLQENSLRLQGKSEKEILQIRINKLNTSIKDEEVRIKGLEETSKLEIAAAERNQEIAKNIIRFGLEASVMTLRALAAPFDLLIEGANKLSETLGFGKITTTNINTEITKLTQLGAEVGSKFLFDPAKVKADSQATITAAKQGLNQMKSDRDGFLLQIKQGDQQGAQDRVNTEKGAAQEQIDITRQMEEEKNRLMEEGRAKDLDALRIKYKYEQQEADKNFKEGKLKKEDYDKLTAQAIESKRLDDKAINDKYDKIEKDARDLKLQEQIKAEDAAWLELQKAKNSQREQELLDLQLAFDEKIAAANGNAEIEKAITDKFNKEYAAINEKYRKEEEEKQKEQDKKDIARKNELRQKTLELTAQSFSALGELAGSFNTKNEKDARKQFQVQKAFNLAAAITNTAMAVTGALTAGGNPIKLATGMQFVEAGIAATVGAANIIKISNSKFGGGANSGGGGNDTNVPTAAPMTANFNTIGSSGINQLAQLQQTPTQAYVVSGEVTSAQALDRNRVQNATL
jgi:hypothetical protein